MVRHLRRRMGKEEHMTDILIVEDHKELSGLLRDFLSAEGYVVRIAETGEQALQLYEEYGARLLVLDILLPGMDHRGTATVKDVLYRLLGQVFEHFLCQPESVEYAVGQFLALKSLNLHFYNFMGCRFPQNYMCCSDSKVSISMILLWFMLI